MRTSLKWGLILAAGLIAWTLLLHVSGIYTTRLRYAAHADTAAVLLPVAALTAALLERRRRDGSLSFRDGFMTGLATALVSWPPTAAFMLFYHRIVHPRWLEMLTEYEVARLREAGAPDAEVAATVSRLTARAGTGAELTSSFMGTLVLGVVLSLVLAVVLRRRSTAG